MIVKSKRLSHGNIRKLVSGGDIKEVLVHSDMFNPNKGKITICYRGKKSSGMIELTEQEAKDLYTTLHKRSDLIKDVKVIKG